MAQNWVVDAASIKIGDTRTIDFLHKTHDIEKFFSKDDKRFAIVASRGVGKTYLLKMKSIKYRNEKKGAIFIPKGNLVDRFSSSSKPIMSYNNMNSLTDVAIHMKLWKLSILVSVIKSVPSLIEASKAYYHSYPELESLLSSDKYVNNSPVHNIYEDMMKNYKYFMDLIKKGALNILDGICSTNLDEPVYIFLDNLDEFYDTSHNDEDNSDYSYSEDLWIAAQVSLLKTVYQLQQSINKINIYLTIRKRAIDEMQKRDMMALQYSGSILFLNYTKQD